MQLASGQMPTLKSLVLEQIYEEALITICSHSTNTGAKLNSENLLVSSFSNTRCWWFSWIGRWGEAFSSFSAVWGFVVSISLLLLEKLEGHHIKGFQETLWSSFRRSSWHLLMIFPKSGSRLFILSVSKQRESFLVCGNLYFCCLTQMLDSIFKYSLHLGGSLAGFLSVPVEASGYTSSSKLASRSTSSEGSSSLK